MRSGITRRWLRGNLLLTVLLLGVYGPGFEASNFIYSQF